jgi:dipeptidyl aminopeptidase/acylaminoacyl peptidase
MKFTSKSLLVLCLPCLLAASEWTVDDLLLMERAGAFEVSRDGNTAVWVKSAVDSEKGRTVSHIMLRYLEEGWELQLTRGKDANTSPRLSPDGRRVAFLGNRPKQDQKEGSSDSDERVDQVWLMDLRGGEPRALTSLENGVEELRWLDDQTLLLVAEEDPSAYSQRNEDREDTSRVVDDEEHAAPVRLFRLEVEPSKLTRLTDNTDRITDLAVSPDGVWAVTVNERSLRYEYDQQIRPITVLHNLADGSSRQILTDGKLLPIRVIFEPDSRGFYFSAPYSTDPVYFWAEYQLLHHYDLQSGDVSQVPLDWDRALAGPFAVTTRGVVALMADGVRHRMALYEREGIGWRREWLTGEHAANIFNLASAPDGGNLLYEYSTATSLPQWYQAVLDDTELVRSEKITSLNGNLDARTKSRSEVVRWQGALDEEVEGLLYYPHDYQEGEKYPLILVIHGGPAGVDLDGFGDSLSDPVNLLTERGAFVLRVNYHGSGGYGLEWGESISGGHYNDLEWIDCDRGVDAMIARGLADPEKLGVMGWSNGSIITIELTTRTDRYKVASAGAGDVNWTSDWGNCKFGHSFDDYYLGTTPLEDPQLYIEKSPLFRMDQVRTPTIIFFGTADTNVPTEQGWQHFRALQQLGNTDVRFVLFPGEPHSLGKLAHQRRKLEEELAWFDRYLFNTAQEANESLRPSSPLAAALRRSEGGQTPQTVRRGDLDVGLFEVTRAQFAAFRSDYSYAAGTDDYPASGISFDDARAYSEWLSKTTGRKFRLPTEAEMKDLLGSATEDGNTLDGWAGYEVNDDDAQRLSDELNRLGPGALLKRVGSLAVQSEDGGLEPIFDLRGNVAEWTVAASGEGKPMGGSADCPADQKSNREPRTDYIGFRVVADVN